MDMIESIYPAEAGPRLLLTTLEALQELDLRELRRGAQYDGGYDAHSTVVSWFWDVRSLLKSHLCAHCAGDGVCKCTGLAGGFSCLCCRGS